MELDKYTIQQNELIEQAIEMIELNNSRCVIVLNEFKKVVGILSEGDILRALLKGISIKSQVRNVMNPAFKYLITNDDERIKEIFLKGITLIPVLTNQNELVSVVDAIKYLSSKIK
jgi:CBS domain-containing protein